MAEISIVMTTYNREKMIRNAIRSVLDQIFTNFEFIIVDDGSTDGTEDVVRSFRDDRIIYLKRNVNSRKHLGLVRNEGIKLAKGTYITYIDDDNTWKRNRLEVLYTFLKKNPDVDLVYHDSEIHEGPARSENFNRLKLLKRNYIDLGEVMHKRSCFEIVGLFDEEVEGAGEDWEMWVRMSKHFKFKHLPIKLSDYYYHSGMTTKDPKHMETLKKIKRKIWRKESWWTHVAFQFWSIYHFQKSVIQKMWSALMQLAL